MDPSLRSLSHPSQCAGSHEWIPSRSGSSSSGVSVCRYSYQSIHALVAVVLTFFGHHRAACGRAGVLSRRGFSVESSIELCREAGARVSTNVVRNLDIAHSGTDARLKVVAERLAIFGGVQLAVNATLVSAHYCDGTPVRKAYKMDGIALQLARRCKEARYPCSSNGRARLVVIAGKCEDAGPSKPRAFCKAWHTARGAPNPPGWRASGLVSDVEQSVGLLSGQGSRHFLVGEAGRTQEWPDASLQSTRLWRMRVVSCERRRAHR